MDIVLYGYVIGLVFAIVSVVTGNLAPLAAGFIFVAITNIVERWK